MRKILCLHGYRQSAQVFKDKTGSLRKLLKKHAELVYISAPHLIPASSAIQDESMETLQAVPANGKVEEQRGWYFSTEQLTFNSHDETDFSWGLQESINVVSKAFEELGPFDGILGFSQGAALGSILCYMLEKGELNFSFRFAILVSGFRSRLSPHTYFYKTKQTIATLHVIGETDRIVEKEMSEELTTYFESPHIMCHSGGHYVPATSKEKEDTVTFVRRLPNQEG
ncbi:esterase OVCA2 [Daphnia magna]|uniref:esterase OVCA2 n=1 Tax=Daphnia magna TaxID=35525 RepID=UPI001E1BC11C|nr:esterase OVCA2 [Daphnia magna]